MPNHSFTFYLPWVALYVSMLHDPLIEDYFPSVYSPAPSHNPITPSLPEHFPSLPLNRCLLLMLFYRVPWRHNQNLLPDSMYIWGHYTPTMKQKIYFPSESLIYGEWYISIQLYYKYPFHNGSCAAWLLWYHLADTCLWGFPSAIRCLEASRLTTLSSSTISTRIRTHVTTANYYQTGWLRTRTRSINSVKVE